MTPRTRFSAALIALAVMVGVQTPLAVQAAKKPAATAGQSELSGLWDGVVQVKDAAIPFRLRLSGAADNLAVTYYDGERPVNASTRGEYRDGQLNVEFASYASRLQAKGENGVLKGTIGALPFEARRHVAKAATPKAPPAIGGVWEIPIEVNAKGEKAWRLIVTQKPAGVYATILRIDGDTGTISGAYEDGAFDQGVFRLSRFAGERPTALSIAPRKDGSLALSLVDNSGRRDLRAVRPEQARREGLAPPTDPTKQTSVRDPKARFVFSGVELGGTKEVTNADPRFKGKVVLVNIMGSWCPNCHDEAAFLAELDAKYRSRGLQVVGLDFESADELQSLTRLKAFVARYNLRYTVLVGGERKALNERVPQAVNLNAWPTSFFVDRSGRVRNVHVGFPSRGSGAFDRKARADIEREIETLLAEKA